MLPGPPRPPWGPRLREILRDGAPAGQLVARVERRHGGDLELGEAGSSSCQVLRAAYAPGVAGEPSFDAGGEVGYVAARFLVSLGARDVQPAGAVGCFHGQVLPLKGCGFAAAQEAIAECAHERDIHVSAPASILAITSQVSPVTCAGFWGRSRRELSRAAAGQTQPPMTPRPTYGSGVHGRA